MKIPEAETRLFNRRFVCRKCKHKVRASASRIKEKTIVCPKCQSRNFRPKSKEKRVAA
ncbi:MAG: 50S ribosomal protein L40e [uncultured DHVE6 group euryarchaeote]|jgi:ribosomal protein L40E|nr:MAG: 50S ribosomal protein L40e [uncultured DHVE6 group euryarchaeote]